MSYSAAQLQQYFYLVAQGQTPDAATLQQIQTAAQQDSAGTISDRQALAVALRSGQALNTTDVASACYQFFTGAFPSQAGLGYLVNNPSSGFNTAYYNGSGTATSPAAGGFNQENRYFNEAVALAEDPSTGSSFRSIYAGLTLAQTVALAYEVIVGTASVGAPAAQAAVASITAAIPYFTEVAQERAGGVDTGGLAGQNIALKAVIVGYIMEEALKADVGVYAQAIDQFNAAIATGTAGYGAALSAYQPAGMYYGKGVGATAFGFSTTVALTTGVDTITSVANDVVYTASAGQSVSGPKPTLNAGDSVTTTGQNTALLLTDTVGGSNVTSGVTFSGFSQVMVQNTAPSTTADTVLDASKLPGVSIITDYLSTGGVQITNIGAGVTVDVNNTNIVTTSPDVSLSYLSNVLSATLCLALNSPYQNNYAAETHVEVAGSGLAALTVDIAGAALLTLSGSGPALGALNLVVTGPSNIDLGSSMVSSVNVSGDASLQITTSSVSIQSVTATDPLDISFTDNASMPTITLGTGVAVATFSHGLSAASTVVLGGQGGTLQISGPFGDGATLTGGGQALLIVNAADLLNELSYSHINRVTGFSLIHVSDPLPNGSIYDLSKLGVTDEWLNGVTSGGTASVVIPDYGTVDLGNISSGVNDGAISIQVGTGSTLATLPQNTGDALSISVSLANTKMPLNVSVLGVENINLSSDYETFGGATPPPVVFNDPSLIAISIIGTISFDSTSSMTKLQSVDASQAIGSEITVITATMAAPVMLSAGQYQILNVGNYVTVNNSADSTYATDLYEIGVIANPSSATAITNEVKGERITFAIPTPNFNNTAITVSAGSSLTDYLNAAAAKADGTISYFTFGGDTYVVDTGVGGGATFANGIDAVVKLTGVHDLSHSTLANGVLTTSG